MDYFSNEELEDALKVISSTILRCQKAEQKFAPGSAQHTLLLNRIKALTISKLLITNDNHADDYTDDELAKALPPLASIISKCEKAQLKFAVGTALHTRFQHMIDAMVISRSFVNNAIDKRK